MTTPRITRLVRVPDLRAMQAVVADLAGAGPVAARRCAVLVPTRSAGEELRRTLEQALVRSAATADPPADPGRPPGRAAAIVLPDLVTRAEFYDRLGGPVPRLSDLEREVIFRRASLDAIGTGVAAPVRLRAGLIAEILAFYDELRRRNRTVDAFERLMVGSLEPGAGIDRGAERLLELTRFLTASFRAFESRIAKAGRADEHGLRTRLLEPGDGCGPAVSPAYRHVVVTVADQAADRWGLWPADYDLLARLPGLERLDIIATDALLATGYLERMRDAFPGCDETVAGVPSTLPVLCAPPAPPAEAPVRWWTSRDREEELATAARHLKTDGGNTIPLHRSAIAFQRPLPYLYLARQVFSAARIPYDALDALPLAAEPFAAALDLVFSFLSAEGSREALVELLGSPQWRFVVEGRPVDRSAVDAADALLHDSKYFGGWDRLAALASGDAERSDARGQRRRGGSERAAPALLAAHAAAAELRPVVESDTASGQVGALLAFVTAHEVLAQGPERHLRARGAILSALCDLQQAYRRHDDAPLRLAELAGTVRRWIEGQTFQPRAGVPGGLRMLDAQAAMFADLDELRLVGLVETDWPERGARNIFYPSSLLVQLGWPPESERLKAARARFQDLLALPRTRIVLSTFTLEEDAVVSPSTLLEDLDTRGLPVEQAPLPPAARVFTHEALSQTPYVPGAIDADARAWAAIRMSRSLPDADVFHGAAGPREPGVYAVSHVERYLDCPFKYFAAYVLKLPEERREESGLTALERGQFLHEVFERFFQDWAASGRGAITADNVPEALAAFERVADEKLATLAESDRALERTHLLGSAAAPGLAERAFAFEIEDGGEILERLLEHTLEGEFAFDSDGGPRRVRVNAKADRIDLLADGTLRIIDYKLGKAPKPSRALQLAVYGTCAEQRLTGYRGRTWALGRAGYIAFKEKNAFVSLGGSSLQEAVGEGHKRFLAAIDAIEQGLFPPKPDEPFLCTRCGYSSVCRKDYVGDE